MAISPFGLIAIVLRSAYTLPRGGVLRNLPLAASSSSTDANSIVLECTIFRRLLALQKSKENGMEPKGQGCLLLGYRAICASSAAPNSLERENKE